MQKIPCFQIDMTCAKLKSPFITFEVKIIDHMTDIGDKAEMLQHQGNMLSAAILYDRVYLLD